VTIDFPRFGGLTYSMAVAVKGVQSINRAWGVNESRNLAPINRLFAAASTSGYISFAMA
jgi:hypothetical protein